MSSQRPSEVAVTMSLSAGLAVASAAGVTEESRSPRIARRKRLELLDAAGQIAHRPLRTGLRPRNWWTSARRAAAKSTEHLRGSRSVQAMVAGVVTAGYGLFHVAGPSISRGTGSNRWHLEAC